LKWNPESRNKTGAPALTALAGAALAHAYGLNMAAPWLVYSYTAFAVLILTALRRGRSWTQCCTRRSIASLRA